MGLRTWLKGQVKQLQGKPQARFEAARSGRLSSDFLRPHTSANAEIRMDLQTLRNSARALTRDNPHARTIKRTFRVNVVGARGIMLRPQVRQLSGDGLDDRRNGMISEEFDLWCRKDCFDVQGMSSFLDAQLAIAGALIDSGEIFFRIVRGRKFGRSKVPLAFEILEADLIDVEKNGLSDRPDHYWCMGVELDRWNRPTRYAVLSRHPGDFDLRNPYDAGPKHTFVPASDMLHVYGVQERVGQLRFEPLLTPVITTAHNLQQYQKAHLVKKRVQSSQLGWITTPDSFEGDIIDNQRTIESEPGVFRRLNAGESVIPPDFGAEDSTYAEFVKDALRTQAVGTGTSYSTISGDFSAGSYASLRINVFESRDYWRLLHTAIIEQFTQPVYEEFLQAAVMYGVLPSPTFDDYFFRPERYTRARHQARSWGLLDVSKDTQAFKLSRELQLETHAEQISNLTGEDFRRTIDEIEAENRYKKSKGLLSELDDPSKAIEMKKPATPASPMEQRDEGDSEDEDEQG